MAGTVEWKVRRGSSVKNYSNGLVVQGSARGMLDLSICVFAEAGSSERASLLGPLSTASTSEAIRKDTGIVCWLHWPDLVTIDGRVVARTSLSVAAQPAGRAEGIPVVLGISINCFAHTLRAKLLSGFPSTSILRALGAEIDLDLLRDKLLLTLGWYLEGWLRGMDRRLAERVSSTVPWLGSEVEVTLQNGPALKGRAVRIDDLGSLVIEQEGQDRKKTMAVRPERVDHVRVLR